MPHFADSEAKMQNLSMNNEIAADIDGGLSDDLKQREFQLILQALVKEKGSRKNVSDKLGISPRTLRYKLAQMRDSGIDIEAAVSAA
jgi:two-component system response regulator FlrC